MNEGIEVDAGTLEKERRLRRRIELSLELSESAEAFPFGGLKEGALEKLRGEDAMAPEGYVTPIDELLKLFEAEGVRVERGPQLISTEKTTSIITVAPAVTGAGAYGENLLHVKNLALSKGMDERLSDLIRLAEE